MKALVIDRHGLRIQSVEVDTSWVRLLRLSFLFVPFWLGLVGSLLVL